MVSWSAVCAVTFLFAHATQSLDYRSFFRNLLGPFWILFEAAYLLFVVLILAVFGAAAGAIGAATLGLPELIGTLALMLAIAAFTAFGNASVERLFKWVTIFLYGVYALFAVLVLSEFGGRAVANFRVSTPTEGWWIGGLTYAGYNVIGAIVILPVLRHLTSRRDALVAGLVAGPLGDLACAALLRLHGCVLPRDRSRDAPIGLPAAAPRSADVPCALPAHDLLGAARERRG